MSIKSPVWLRSLSDAFIKSMKVDISPNVFYSLEFSHSSYDINPGTLIRVAVRYLLHNEVFKLIDCFWTEALMC